MSLENLDKLNLKGLNLDVRNESSCSSMLVHECLDLQLDVLKLKFLVFDAYLHVKQCVATGLRNSFRLLR